MRQQLEKERIDGEAARQLLGNSQFKLAWESAENSILEQMSEVSMRDAEMHTRLIMALQILHNVRHHIETVLQTGEMAEIQLNQPNKLSSALGR